MRKGRLQRRGHDDGPRRQSSGEPLHGTGAYRALSASTGGSSGSLGRRGNYGGGAGVARHGLRAAMATAELRALGGCCSGEEGTPEGKWERGATRAGAGGDEGTPRRGVACAVKALVTHGRRRGHAARDV
ncbi:uncharacterized protein [Miscanthus floridulus]|uniref:uncharacterized protein n=1 Tax=Miscanthus floridulus TaxID=154761 RepID=UPI003459F771